MSDIAITAANVVPSPDATYTDYFAGAPITAGQVVFIDSDGTAKPADANGTAPAFNVRGIALNTAATGQPVAVCTKDKALAIGGNVATGSVVILSATPGAIAPAADAASGMYVTMLGIGIGSNKINFNPVGAGVAVP